MSALRSIVFPALLATFVVVGGAHCGDTSDSAPPNDGGGLEGGSVGDGGALGDAAFPGDAGVVTTSTVSQFGITWTFDAPHTVGQFANGDFWVLGPVTVTSVSPAPASGRNGSVLDPKTAVGQGYDDRGDDYDASLAASFPLAMKGVSSLVSSASHPTSDCKLGGGADGYSTYDGDCQGGPVATQAVLTVVDAPPAPGTFRPPYVGGAPKTMHAWSSLNLGLLPKLPKPASAPSDDEALRHVERPWIDHMTTWTLQYACATDNMYCYGREIGHVVSEVASYVLLDTPVQTKLAIRLVQLGIDNYGVVATGHDWGQQCAQGGCGGHMNGRKWPIVFAGLLLGDAAMKSVGPVSNEDQQTYYGTNGTALWGAPCTACYQANGCQYGGSCPNGAKECRDPAGLVDGCTDYRDCCTSLVWPGQALSMLILHAKATWNHDAFFDYTDRWMNGAVSGPESSSSKFVDDMWKTYRNNLP